MKIKNTIEEQQDVAVKDMDAQNPIDPLEGNMETNSSKQQRAKEILPSDKVLGFQS